jgi:two-component system chemotaxis response regulator CheB
MDGLTFLKKIMAQHPLPVVVFSSTPAKNFKVVIEAFRLGAVDVIQKPVNFKTDSLTRLSWQLREAIKGAAISQGNLKLYRSGFNKNINLVARESVNEPIKESASYSCNAHDSIIFIGASAGGVQTIEYLISNLSPPMPPVLISQHMPGDFTRAYAERLNNNSALAVKEAENGELVKENHVYIANGFNHMAISKSTFHYKIRLIDKQVSVRYKPSVDILFHSAAECLGSKAVGIILTGMGNDGTTGLLEMKRQGALTIAQDQKSSLVWGMPGSAVKADAVSKIYSLTQILDLLITYRLVKDVEK